MVHSVEKKPYGLKYVEKHHRQMHKYETVGRMAESEHTQSRFAMQRERGHAPHATAPHTTV